jgi:hypothetical protein
VLDRKATSVHRLFGSPGSGVHGAVVSVVVVSTSILLHMTAAVGLKPLFEGLHRDSSTLSEDLGAAAQTAAREDAIEVVIDTQEELVDRRLPPEPVEPPSPAPPVVEKIDEPKPRAPDKKRALKVVHEAGSIAIETPIPGPDAEPPPDTKYVGVADRRVAVEEQPRIRALQPSRTARPSFAPKPEAEERKVESEAESTRQKAAERPKGDSSARDRRSQDAVAEPAREAQERRAARKAGKSGLSGSEATQPARKEGLAPELREETTEGTRAGAPNREIEAKKSGDAGERGDDSERNVEAALQVDPSSYLEQFGDRDAADRHRLDGAEQRFLGKWQKRSEQVRASLENFAPQVRYGNQLLINTRRSDHAVYIAKIHRTVHRRWAYSYLRHLDLHYPIGHPLSNSALAATVEFVIDGASGDIVECNLHEGSGELEYDAEALTICYEASPRIAAPESIVSPDGRVYLHWSFWRNTRQCGTFGVSIFVLDDSGKIDTYEAPQGVDDLDKDH